MVRVRLDEPSKAFRTFLNYVANVSMKIASVYGSNSSERYAKVYEATVARCSTVELRHVSAEDVSRAEQHFRCALSNAACLHRDAQSQDFFEAKNAWTPAEAWYAVHHAYCALRVVTQAATIFKHTRTTRDAAQLVRQQGLLPYPWSLHVVTKFDRGICYTHHGFRQEPRKKHNLANPSLATFEDGYALMLRATAKKRADEIYSGSDASKKGTSLVARREAKARIHVRLGATTLFDVLYRLRLRANYGDLDTFVIGSSSPTDARRFARALEVIADSTVAAIEAVISSYLGPNQLRAMIGRYARHHRDSEIVSARAAYHL